MSGAATAELVRLIDLSLGSQPSGAVNFNYLHTLMHAIVGRLGSIEHAYLAGGPAEGLILQPPRTGDVVAAGGGAGTVGGGGLEGASGWEGTTTAGGGGGEKKEGEPSGPEGKEGAVAGGTSQPQQLLGKAAEEAADGAGEAASKEPPLATPGPGGEGLSESRISSSGRVSRAGGQSDFYQRQKSSFVTAANDLGALERKLQELEGRLNAMDTLPELLERKSSDMGATPIKDRWNFTNLSKRLSAAEDGLEQVCVCVCVCVL